MICLVIRPILENFANFVVPVELREEYALDKSVRDKSVAIPDRLFTFPIVFIF